MGSHTCVTFPPGGRRRRVPFRYLVISGCWPRGVPSTDMKHDKKERVVFIELYPTPELKYDVINSIHCRRGEEVYCGPDRVDVEVPGVL